jgi:hypothetical protein
MTFALVIPVMRKPMLKQSLQYYCDLMPDLISNIVVVDYDYAFSKRHNLYKPLSRVKHLSAVIEAETYFNKSRAINLGVALSEASYIIGCDADVLINIATLSSWAQTFLDRPSARIALTPTHMVETADGLIRDAPGIVALAARSFLAVQGYSSEFLGWGFEDRDFLWRLNQVGIQVIKTGVADHISHSEIERTQNYPLADGVKGVDALTARLTMRQRNLVRFAARKDARITTGSLFVDLARYGLTGFWDQPANDLLNPGRFRVIGADTRVSRGDTSVVRLSQEALASPRTSRTSAHLVRRDEAVFQEARQALKKLSEK